jgi:hypothetical protein
MYKKFDLEAAKNGAPVITRDGKPARIICFDLKYGKYPLGVAVDYGEHEDIKTYSVDGVFRVGRKDNKLDLSMAPVKKKGWINIYPPSTDSRQVAYISNAFATVDDANEAATSDRIACIEIEWPE